MLNGRAFARTVLGPGHRLERVHVALLFESARVIVIIEQLLSFGDGNPELGELYGDCVFRLLRVRPCRNAQMGRRDRPYRRWNIVLVKG
ncbi:hypothetical protein AYI69_g10521 [Smittium culicis]|uniref:Uncharacterized protein n=1 Tax=Smittium culicis TaxID=133412 RepID=A0A1R1X552_9FUNG|nr:hypothetical protein AYI69_g10521 [Smittium culicis]